MWSAGVMLYVLLASKYPFDPDCDDSQLEAAIQRCECVLFLPFPSPVEPLSAFSSIRRFDRAALDTVSDAARSLVFGLLELDPSRRLTAQQALQHPFILQLSTAHTEMKPSPRRSSVLDKLKRTVTVIRGYQVR
jgi:calcium-dependent protein kinase